MKKLEMKLLILFCLSGCGSRSVDSGPASDTPGVMEHKDSPGKSPDPGRAAGHRTMVFFLPGGEPLDFPDLSGNPGFRAFHPGESTVTGAFVQLMAGTMLHRVFAERLMQAGQGALASSVSPGVLLQAAETTAVWAPGLGSGHGIKGLVRQFPSRAPRVRSEVVSFSGEGEFRGERGNAVSYSVRRSADGKSVVLRVQGPVRRLYHSKDEAVVDNADYLEVTLFENDVTTLFLQHPEGDFAVSLGLKKILQDRIVWHREGPVPEGLFPPPDMISLRMRELSVHMQADFITGAFRAQMQHAAKQPPGLAVVYVPSMLDLAVSLSLSPGSWNGKLGKRLAGELEATFGRLKEEGVQVITVGLHPLLPVREIVDRRFLAALPADHVVPGYSSALFLWNESGLSKWMDLEEELFRKGLNPENQFYFSSVPGGIRMDFPPGLAVGVCPGKQARCKPSDDSGQLVSSPFLKGWFSLPEGCAGIPAAGLFDLMVAVSGCTRGNEQMKSVKGSITVGSGCQL